MSSPHRQRRWTVQDRNGNEIYMTEERWRHALEHRYMRAGHRRRDVENLDKFWYYKRFSNLPNGNQYVIVVVKWEWKETSSGETIPNHFVLTAYMTLTKP